MKIPLQTVLKTFRRRLTNLSSLNRSLLLTSLPAGQFLDLHEADFLLNKPSFTVIADLVARKPSVALCEVLDPRQERSNEVSRKLRKIDRTARFIEEERGTEDLYVGWPFVKGKFLDDTVVHGPLLFFPVKIEQQGKFWKLVRRGDELAFLNPTLALAYGQFNQVRLPDDLVEKTMDDLDRDPVVFRTQLYEWLKSSPLEINFNQDLFVDKLQFFNKQTAKDLGQLERTGELKLYPEAILGIFPQAGSFLVPDYDALLARSEVPGAGREEQEVEGEEKEEIAPVNLPTIFPMPHAPHSLPPTQLPEKNIHTPLPMDASQELALRAVKAGQSLVVQGPPGTGKSQLIANLMADAAASGKRVLLVCQKRAALDVVQERLEQVGMGSFLALIHDFQDDRRALYAQIASQIDQVDAFRQQNNSLNAVLLERDFEIESKRIDETVTALKSFKDALFDTSECSLSAKELYLISEPDKPTIPLEDIYTQFPLNNVDNFVRRLGDYVAYQQRLGSDHPWAERVNFALFLNADLTKADQVINELTQLRNDTNGQTATFLSQPLALAELAEWQARDWELTALLNLLTGDDAVTLWEIVKTFRNNPSHPAFTTEETQLEKIAQTWDNALETPGPELSLQPIELPPFRELLADALAARPSWMTWNWWQLTKSGKTQLQNVASANGLALSENDLRTLTAKVAKRVQLETVQQHSTTLLTGLSLPNSPDSIRLVQRAQHITERLNALQLLHRLPESCWQTSKKFMDVVTNLLRVAATVEKQRIEAQVYLTTDQIHQLWEDDVYADNLRRILSSDFDLLVEADRLQQGFSETERTVINRLSDHEPLHWEEMFQESVYRAWIGHIEAKYPELRSVSSLKMGQWEQTLQESVRRKQILSRDILLVKLREQTYRNLMLNRLSNVVTYRDLLHQTSKKRNVWPVRKLMESFADEVFKLVPCWLASPESVSAMFPLREGLFDLVIFDEASQCFAENGVPAMVRGKQVVITGDNQQLRPSDLYRIRIDENELAEETPAALEVESLLELAAQELPQVSLNEHYRSRSLDLITFSNEHFYQNKLSLLPHFDVVNRHEPAIRYVNVKGIWQQNTNLAEADAILQLLDQLTTELPGRSVGIVTFNYPQQQLIQDMLEDRFLAEAASDGNKQEIPAGLFVKNIENVQGDERDVIIFSVGYAPDERGKLSMQFGSLNARGGGNRLNVAVTRARERVYVVTSLWPDQLTIADTANEGPRLLKAYLAYALNVAQQQFRPTLQTQQIFPSGTLLKDKLAAQHPDWQPELPFADLTVKTDDTYQSLVLTDDDTYYQQTLKQTHAYLPIALQARKWPFQRVWSREYWRDKSKKA
ncbi:AAA domain-containing protein [Spirosoma endophyticum]|uniref:AAA domain-containing protein n=1 Tax=Spirosoma endophyticum TaxID=662367 RepID=A0A1I1SVV0_9BACT|nr:AAA domain-containing protein [Spirosoma endophyticum]SFD50482.1 AAA domain-containing protein [Spirosoma endophyticum]